MITKISDTKYNERINEFILYVKRTNSFPVRGKKDIKFSDNSCLMGEWFKSNRKKLKNISNSNKTAKALLELSDFYMTKTDKENVSNRLNKRIEETISFISTNNYFPNKNDNIYFKDKSSLIYVWYICNKKRIIELSSKGDIYAKELLSLEKQYKNNNKYPKEITYQNKKYTYKDFAKLLNIKPSYLNLLISDYCKNIYNIKPLELERIRNTVININRLKELNTNKYNNLDKSFVKYCNRHNICLDIVNEKINYLINQGLTKKEASESIINTYKNNGNSIPLTWIYDKYSELSNDNLMYDKNIIIKIIIDKGLSLKEAILLDTINNNTSNTNEKEYFKDIIYYTLISNNKQKIEYSKNLFKLDDYKTELINKINDEYNKSININILSDRKSLINGFIENYDDYSINKRFFQEAYNLTKYEIMTIEARHNEEQEDEENILLGTKKM